MISKHIFLLFSVCCFLTILGSNKPLADGQGLPINYDSISFLKKPMAFSFGPATLSTNVILDQRINYNISNDEDTYNSRVNGNFVLETQLPNDWQLGLQYFARYDRLADNDENDEYRDDFSFFMSDYWGTVALGNVTQSVFAEARRSSGFGNADLSYDNFIGALDETGSFYNIRFNAYEFLVTADQEGRAEAAFVYEQPVDTDVYFLSARFTKGNTQDNAGFQSASTNETYGAAFVGKYTYASFQLNTQFGYEFIEELDDRYNDHYFGSLGVLYKYGAYRLSAEGSLANYDKQDRRSFALGSHIDVARGLSWNAGLNYAYEDKTEDLSSIVSLRYEF